MKKMSKEQVIEVLSVVEAGITGLEESLTKFVQCEHMDEEIRKDMVQGIMADLKKSRKLRKQLKLRLRKFVA